MIAYKFSGTEVAIRNLWVILLWQLNVVLSEAGDWKHWNEGFIMTWMFLFYVKKWLEQRIYRKIPKISPSKYKPPKLVTLKTLR